MDNQEKDFKDLNIDNKFEKTFGVKESFILISGVIIILLCSLIVSNMDKVNETFSEIKNIFYSNTGNAEQNLENDDIPEFTPYMRRLQSKIKSNWHPPKQAGSNNVVLLFKIGKDGCLISHQVMKSSNNADVDKAAVDALMLSAPFEPLPEKYSKSFVDVQFTFDYNVRNLN